MIKMIIGYLKFIVQKVGQGIRSRLVRKKQPDPTASSQIPHDDQSETSYTTFREIPVDIPFPETIPSIPEDLTDKTDEQIIQDLQGRELTEEDLKWINEQTQLPSEIFIQSDTPVASTVEVNEVRTVNPIKVKKRITPKRTGKKPSVPGTLSKELGGDMDPDECSSDEEDNDPTPRGSVVDLNDIGRPDRVTWRFEDFKSSDDGEDYKKRIKAMLGPEDPEITRVKSGFRGEY